MIPSQPNLNVPPRISLLNWAGSTTFTVKTRNLGLRFD